MTNMLLTGVGSGELVTATAISDYTDIAGCYLLVEAQRESYSNGNSVSSMTDWSARGNTLVQAGIGVKPTFATSQVNGLAAYSFDGNDYVAKTSATGIGASALTAFAVVLRNGTGGRRTIFYAGDVNNSGRQVVIDASEKFRLTKSQVAEVGASTTVVSNSSYELWCVTFDGTNYAFYRNGTLDNSGSQAMSFVDTTPTLYVGGTASTGVSEQMDGKLALGVLYDSVLSTSDRQSVENKVRATYALW